MVMPGVGIGLFETEREGESQRENRERKPSHQPSIEMQKRHYPHTL